MSSSPFNVKNQVVRAGAGAGKTTGLINCIISFYRNFCGASDKPPRVVVCTFTRKATQELRERLMREALKLNDWDFVRFVSSHQLFISTIHGVLLKFLNHYGYRIGLGPQLRFIDSTQATVQAKKIMREVLVSDVSSQDRKIILTQLSVHKLAELGRKYYEFVGYLQNAQMHTAESLDQLFQNEVLELENELSKFQQELKPYLGEKPIVNDFNQWLMQASKVLAKLKSGQMNLQDFQNFLATLPAFRRQAKNPPRYEDVLVKIRDWQKQIQKDWVDPTYNPQKFIWMQEVMSTVEKCLKHFVEKFKLHKITNGQLEIADLEILSLFLIRQHPDTAQLFAVDWDYWLVDEYQDTSPIQVELIKHLKGNRPSFIVGDPQQSIYLFRGARCEVFEAQEKQVQIEGGEVLLLEKNYRSRPALVHYFNSVFSRFSGQFFPMTPACLESSLGFSDVRYLIQDPQDESHLAVVCEVLRLLAAKINPQDICILARTNKSLKEVAKALRNHGVPCILHAAGGFYERREILDALALFTFLLNPHDDKNLIGLLRSPWFKLTDKSLLEIFSSQREFSFWSVVEKKSLFQQEPVLGELKKLLSRREQESILQIFKSALVEFGFFDFSYFVDGSGRQEANLWKLVNELERACRQPGFNFLELARQKMQEVALENLDDSEAVSSQNLNYVNLMTIHQAKGLEFDHVIVLDIDANPLAGHRQKEHWSFDEEDQKISFSIFNPEDMQYFKTLGGIHCQRQMEKRELEESLRILYVALTRAAQSLVLVGSENPQKNCWQSFLNFNFSPGDYAQDGFTYSVVRGPWEVLKTYSPEIGVSPVLEPLKLKPMDGVQKISVTDLVYKSSEAKFKKTGHKISEANEAPQGFLKQGLAWVEKINYMTWGVRMHRLLETIGHQGLAGGMRAAEQFFPENSKEVCEALQWVYSLEEPCMHKLLKTGFVEWGFHLKQDAQIIEGQIDLWGRVDSKTWIIDYKTGSTKNLAQAMQQLNWYAQALRAYGIKDDIYLAVIFPFAKKVEIRRG